MPARREVPAGPCAAAGTDGVDPVAGWPGMPLRAGPLPVRAGRAGRRRDWAEIQTRAGRPR